MSKFFILFMFYVVLASCQQQVPIALKANLPDGTNILDGKLIPNFLWKECWITEKKIVNRINSGTGIDLDAESYDSWESCLKANENISTFFLMPGDYTKWGTLKLQGKSNLAFTHRNYLIIQAGKPPQHPVNMSLPDQAILGNFIFLNCNNIILNGLTFAGKDYHAKIGKYAGWQNKIVSGSNNTINKCVVKDIFRGSGIRIFNSNENEILNSVFEQTDPALTGDHVAIYILANEGQESRGNQVLNNEIINWNDGFMLGWSLSKKNKSSHQTGDCPATVFAYNNIYLTPGFYDDKGKAFAENAIDLKNGTASRLQEDKIKIYKNKIWGFRPTIKKWSSGSSGAAITIHVNASNIEVSDNIVFDVPVGIAIRSNPKKYKGAKTENILIRKNFFSNINANEDSKESGIGITSNTSDVKIIENVFHNVDRKTINQRRNQAVIESKNYSTSKKSQNTYYNFEVALSKWKKVNEEIRIKTFQIYQ